MEQFPQVDEFHLSGNYPWIVPENGKVSVSTLIPQHYNLTLFISS